MKDSDSDVQLLAEWMVDVSGPEWIWYVKYLAVNDTAANPKSHQGGPLMGKPLLKAAFPVFSQRANIEKNPELLFDARLESDKTEKQVRFVWYNERRLSGKGRDEARITRWGGKKSPLLNDDAPGTLVVFAFRCRQNLDPDLLSIWRCGSPREEEYLLERLPLIEPGVPQVIMPDGVGVDATQFDSCALIDDEIPSIWKEKFPTGELINAWAIERAKASGTADTRLLARRKCEEAVFYSVERFHSLNRIREGFPSVEAFIKLAGSITNRRKARSGRSLELHVRRIFEEEGVAFKYIPKTEQKKSPDFIFPSIEAYRNLEFPSKNLRMLATKTTCKDRWRQILNEADRIGTKHLLTLQEGVSEAQLLEMEAENVQLVVPKELKGSYPKNIRDRLLTLESFIDELLSLDKTVSV